MNRHERKDKTLADMADRGFRIAAKVRRMHPGMTEEEALAWMTLPNARLGGKVIMEEIARGKGQLIERLLDEAVRDIERFKAAMGG